MDGTAKGVQMMMPMVFDLINGEVTNLRRDPRYGATFQVDKLANGSTDVMMTPFRMDGEKHDRRQD